MRWVNLELVIQSEKSEREKNKYILMPICGIEKISTDDLICREGMETQRTNLDIAGKEEGGRNRESSVDIYTLSCGK